MMAHRPACSRGTQVRYPSSSFTCQMIRKTVVLLSGGWVGFRGANGSSSRWCAVSDADLGGEAPCALPLVDDDGRVRSGVVVVPESVASGSGGAIWSLPHTGDLDANLVRLDPDGVIAEHVNDAVDVLMVVRSGSGRVIVDRSVHQLGPDHLVLIPRGASRSIAAGSSGIAYLSVHRHRSPLTLGTKPHTVPPERP